MHMPTSHRRSINGWAIAAVLWLVGLCVVALYWGLFVLAPLDKTEALQIGVAESMQRLDEWVVPQWNGHTYAEKPPLPYWLAGLVWNHLGLVPEMARVPAALTGTLGVALLAWFTHRLLEGEVSDDERWKRAAVAGSLLALSPGWIAFSRTAVHDIYLAVSVAMAIVGYAIGFCLQPRRYSSPFWATWIGVWCGVGFLAKGLLGIGLPLLIMGFDAVLHRESRRSLIQPVPLALLTGGLLTTVSPWLIALRSGQHNDYLDGFFGFSHLQRATSAVDGHDQPLIFYLPVLIGMLWPWWPMLIQALQQQWRKRSNWLRTDSARERVQRLATVWLLVGLALFSTIATKLPGYILPVIPAAVVLMALSHPYPRWCLRLVALQIGALTVGLLIALMGAHLGLLGEYGRQFLASPATLPWVAMALVLSLSIVLSSQATRQPQRRWLALVCSLILVVSTLPSLARVYRAIEQEPILALARTAHQIHGSARSLYVLGKPHYSVVAEAELPTIFGSPLKTIEARPTSSFLNGQRFGHDQDALVLGNCRAVQRLSADRTLHLEQLVRRRNHCLAHLHRHDRA